MSLKFFCLLLVTLLAGSVFVNAGINVDGVVSVEVETVDPSTFRDYTIFSENGLTKAIDGDHNTKWAVSFSSLDKEMLPNGNLLVTSDPRYETSSVKEINITSNSVVWETFSVASKNLSFTHDVDWLGVDQFGQDIFLIADTLNDRVVEFFRNGTVIWSWYAADHYSYENPRGMDWTHLNDADRLPDGTTMISLRNFNITAIVNTTATGEVLWEYGEYMGIAVYMGQHNPEYTSRRTLLIADSIKNRIIEVNMTTKEIIWEYAPTGDEFLGWPRDADLLPNGNILICDTRTSSGKNRIWEINATTKEVVWYHDTADQNYDAERMDTVLPTVHISSPAATTYGDTTVVPVSLSCDDPWYDEMSYRIYDETAGHWVTAYNITYDGPTEAFLESQHTYTLYAWAKDLVMEGGAYPTSRAIVQLDEDSVQFTTGVDDTDPEILDVYVTSDADITFTATAIDYGGWVKQVTLDYGYTNDNETGNKNVDMTNVGGNLWSVVVSAFQGNTTFTYTVTAKDNSGNSVTTNEMRYDHIVPELSSVTLLALFIFFSVVSIIYQKRGKKRLSQ